MSITAEAFINLTAGDTIVEGNGKRWSVDSPATRQFGLATFYFQVPGQSPLRFSYVLGKGIVDEQCNEVEGFNLPDATVTKGVVGDIN